MINEWEEFCAYTGTVSYTASKKSDTTWLGRFTFATILEFEGMARILTVLARGYLFHSKDESVISGDPHDRIDYARRALCAWCSVPEDGKRAPDKEWQFQTDFSELHTEFPELVGADGTGWFLRHVLCAADFMLTHPEKVRSTSLKYAEVIRSKFAAAWRSKVIQYQIPIFAPQTKGAWTLRFDDVLADALELGPLRREEPELPPELTEGVKSALPKEIPSEVVCTLIRYYLANRQDVANGWFCRWQTLTPISGTPASARSICPRSRRRSWSGAAPSASAGIRSRKNICHRIQTAGQAFTACPAVFLSGFLKVFSLSMAAQSLSCCL